MPNDAKGNMHIISGSLLNIQRVLIVKKKKKTTAHVSWFLNRYTSGQKELA